LANAGEMFRDELQYFAADKELFVTKRSKRVQKFGKYSFNRVTRRHVFSDIALQEVVALNPSYNADYYLEDWEYEFNQITRLHELGLQTLWVTEKCFRDENTDAWGLCKAIYDKWRFIAYKSFEQN